MSMSMKFSLSVAVAGMLLASQWAAGVDHPNNDKIDPKDPVVMCQKDCQREKNSESYEACMLKCNDLQKNQTPTMSYPKK